jgi:hypothetical protein
MLVRFLRSLLCPRPPGRLHVTVGPVAAKKGTPMVTVVLTTEQKVRIAVAPQTSSGSPAQVDGAVLFSVTSGDCTIEPIDNTSAFIVSGSAPGDSVIAVTADADLGAGVEEIADTVQATVTHPKATSLGLTADAPVTK